MTLVEQALAIVQKYPGLSHRESDTSITVDRASANGFSVSLHATGNDFVVHYNGWHEHFATETEASRP